MPTYSDSAIRLRGLALTDTSDAFKEVALRLAHAGARELRSIFAPLRPGSESTTAHHIASLQYVRKGDQVTNLISRGLPLP